MMKRFTQLITLFLAVSIALSLAGCAASAETENRDYEIQRFTDRSDIIYEDYEPPAEVAYAVTARQGTYHFSDEDMPRETMVEYLDASEAGIGLLAEWFGETYDALKLYLFRETSRRCMEM